MGYKYKGTIETDYPFFLEAGFELDGIKRKDHFNGREIYDHCRCPRCGKKESALYLGRRGDSFLFKCPRDKCSLKAMTLHTLIKEHFPAEMFERWRKARWETTYQEDWLPIKNRQSR